MRRSIARFTKNANMCPAILALLSMLALGNPAAAILPSSCMGPTEFNQDDFPTVPNSFTNIAKAVIPTVVAINSVIMIYASELWNNQLNNKELRDFWGDQYLNLPLPNEFRQKGTGSGIIVSVDGYILTNMHVVEKAERITVTLSDDRSYEATLIGADPLTELAVIKIDAHNLPVAKFGNSDSVEIGEWVLAIGNPLELRSTVTAGIVSALGRDINIISDSFGVENFIQTDAPINPGNSGGPLVNMRGQVIGINTAIATQSGYNQGYGFAIPINLAKDIMKKLIQHGYVIRSYLGIAMQDVNEKIARAMRLKFPFGVFIDNVAEDSPAEKAGVQEKDILIKIDHQVVNKGNIVQSIIAQKKPGDVVWLTLLRGTQLLKLPVTLAERTGYRMPSVMPRPARKFRNLGLEVETITSRLAEQLNIKMGDGVLVVSVQQFSPGHDAGIEPNDIILEIDGQKISSVLGFESQVSELTQGTVSIFKIKRGEFFFHCFVEVF